MKIVRFTTGNKVKYGILNGESIHAIEGKPFRYLKLTDDYYRLNDVKLLYPCLPSKIVWDLITEATLKKLMSLCLMFP